MVGTEAPQGEHQGLGRGDVDPVRVVDGHHDRTAALKVAEQVEELGTHAQGIPRVVETSQHGHRNRDIVEQLLEQPVGAVGVGLVA